jgi:hypothetical protein
LTLLGILGLVLLALLALSFQHVRKSEVEKIIDEATHQTHSFNSNAAVSNANDLIHGKLNESKFKYQPLVVSFQNPILFDRGLAKLKALGPSIAPDLEAYVKRNPDNTWGIALATAVIASWGDKGMDSLLRLSGRDATTVRSHYDASEYESNCRSALISFGQPAVDRLVGLIETGSPHDREFAWQMLYEIVESPGVFELRDPSGSETLVKLPRTLRPQILDRLAACRKEELALINSSGIRPAPGDSLWYCRRGWMSSDESVNARLQTAEQVNTLNHFLQRTRQLGYERAGLIRALGCLTSPDGANAVDMQRILESEDAAGRTQAAYELGKILEHQSLPLPLDATSIALLREHTKDHNGLVRLECWSALCDAARSHAQCVPDLDEAVRQGDQDIRRKAGIIRGLISGVQPPERTDK